MIGREPGVRPERRAVPFSIREIRMDRKNDQQELFRALDVSEVEARTQNESLSSSSYNY